MSGHDNLIIGARRGSPLAIGYGDGEMYLGSDAIALAPFTNKIAYLEEGDCAVLTHEGAVIRDENGRVVNRPIKTSMGAAFIVDKGNHRHFMAKEIHEQPEVIGHTLAHYADFSQSRIVLPALPVDLAEISRLTISACGTAYYAGLVSKYWFERYARLPVEIDIASEFRYREAPLPPKAGWRCSSPSRARRPTPWPVCAIAATTARRSFPWSTCWNRPSRGSRTASCPRWPVRKSAWRPPRRSPVSSRFWRVWPSRPGGRGAC